MQYGSEIFRPTETSAHMVGEIDGPCKSHSSPCLDILQSLVDLLDLPQRMFGFQEMEVGRCDPADLSCRGHVLP